MIYSTKNAFKERHDVSYLEAGIHENVEFLSIRKGLTKTDNPLIEFKFQKNGEVLTHTEFEPTKFSGMTDRDLEIRAQSQMDRIIQIMSVYFDESALDFTTDSFDKLADWVVALMSNAPKIPVRLKAVYSNSGFVGLPSSARYTFIEKMSEPVSKIKKLSADKFERPDMADKEEKTQDSSSEFLGDSIAGQSAPF